MKFKAVKKEGEVITEGQVYYGSIIWKYETKKNVQPATSQDLKIVVYNDTGHWSAYSPSTFEPVRE